MQVRFRIQRFNPAQEEKPHWDEFQVELEPTDRVLDGLEAIKAQRDGGLAYRRSCGHGVCGSDAMLINGRNRLACKVLVQSVKQPITIEPMRGLSIEKDLIVDMKGFFSKYRAVKPYLMEKSAPPKTERIQLPADLDKFEDTSKCISCGACTTSCPSFWSNPKYVGPAAIVQAHRFIFDNRDEGRAERLEALNDREGVWRCRTIFNCTDACPRGINVTRAIGEVKKALANARRKSK